MRVPNVAEPAPLPRSSLAEGLKLAEQYILEELDTAEGRQVVVNLIGRFQAGLESQTHNAALRQVEEMLFETVKAYILPPVSAPVGPPQ